MDLLAEATVGVVEALVERNAKVGAERFTGGLRMMPSLRTIVIACVDPRVDPNHLLVAEPGELAVLRNVGGRVTAVTLDELALLRSVTRAMGADLAAGWEIVVLQHTDCGITRIPEVELLDYFGAADLTERAVADPPAALAHDVGLVRADPRVPGVRVSGVLHDVATGLVTMVVAP